jgi:RNA polymerase sigma-70 factor (ECF subfamily)
MQEADLIAAARLGDEDAFTELYQRHLGYVRAVGRAVLRRNDVEDMCQDTFLLAFTRLHSFEGNSHFRTWITRIAINQCLLALRKSRQASNGESHLMQFGPEIADDEVFHQNLFATIDADLEGVPTRLDLDRLLRVLKPLQRRVLEMSYLEGVPEQEIAEILGIALSAVKSKIYHAKRRLRKVLNEM